MITLYLYISHIHFSALENKLITRYLKTDFNTSKINLYNTLLVIQLVIRDPGNS